MVIKFSPSTMNSSPLLSVPMKHFLLLLCLSSPIKLFGADTIPLQFNIPSPSYSLDFGGIISHSPSLVLNPKNPEEISLLLKSITTHSTYNNITVAARGEAHSVHGQAQALDGIVVDMTRLPRTIAISRAHEDGDRGDGFFVDVDGGARWVEVLEETLKHGLAPRSWTDYLYLTVGGTLSVGGISGQTFKHGPQISNVLELDVVTGKGEFLTCSQVENSDLFHGALGGLGQFGIITRARIILRQAPKMVKWIRVLYDDFDQFLEDEELLITRGEVDYLEGFINLSENGSISRFASHINSDAERNSRRMIASYSIEIAIYYNNIETIQKKSEEILSGLRFIPSKTSSRDVSYFDFLNRVRYEEEELRSEGVWEVPHPWLNLFVPKLHIKQFKDLLLETISVTPINGPLILYPILRHKWSTKMSSVLPEEDDGNDIFYVVSLLRSALPPCSHESSCIQTLLEQNQKLINIATSKAGKCTGDDEQDTMGIVMAMDFGRGEVMAADLADDFCPEKKVDRRLVVNKKHCRNGMGGKQYIPYYMEEKEWRLHFGKEWKRFEELKSKFDPLNILAPGQMIFKRKGK